MADPNQCALAADGSLLDAANIVFYNDPDDDAPLPSSKSASTLTPVHPFFQGGAAVPAPDKLITGSRRSGRVTRPSARITDPNNMETLPSTVARKRSATISGASVEASLRGAGRAKLADVDDEIEDDESDTANFIAEDDNIETSYPTTEEEDGGHTADIECIEEAYLTTKAMGDTDRQVCIKILV
jgi:hypothetical protein